VGLFSPPTPGMHSSPFAAGAAAGVMPPLLHSQSHGVGIAAAPASSALFPATTTVTAQPHRMPHPQSFPSLANVAADLPLSSEAHREEGQPPLSQQEGASFQ